MYGDSKEGKVPLYILHLYWYSSFDARKSMGRALDYFFILKIAQLYLNLAFDNVTDVCIKATLKCSAVFKILQWKGWI